LLPKRSSISEPRSWAGRRVHHGEFKMGCSDVRPRGRVMDVTRLDTWKCLFICLFDCVCVREL
jgi:hypothetical protein